MEAAADYIIIACNLLFAKRWNKAIMLHIITAI